LARQVEDAGFDAIYVPDHLGPRSISPLVAVTAALTATTSLRGGTLVLNNGLRHPAAVARDAASISLLTDGRFELGLGAGYGDATAAAAGCELLGGPERVERLDEAAELIGRIWEGAPVDHHGRHYRVEQHECAFADEVPRVPLLIGGNGRRTLEVAGRRADIVGFIGVSPGVEGGPVRPTALTHESLARQIEVVAAAADAHARRPRRSVLVQEVVVTDHRRRAAEVVQEWLPAPVEDILDSPYFLIGSAQEITERVHRLREDFGISRITVFGSSLGAMSELLAHLR
jgi:probable F420-dependent oxidoreductase